MAGMSSTELVERGISQGVFRTPLGELTKLAPRAPVELTSMEQLEGSIEWLSRRRRRRVPIPPRRQHPPAPARLPGLLGRNSRVKSYFRQSVMAMRLTEGVIPNLLYLSF